LLINKSGGSIILIALDFLCKSRKWEQISATYVCIYSLTKKKITPGEEQQLMAAPAILKKCREATNIYDCLSLHKESASFQGRV
jgi:hypothetical protein